MISNKKILIYVEGPSDMITIKALMDSLASEYEENIIVLKGDIFANWDIKDVKQHLEDKVQAFCSSNGLSIEKDIERIIQITDSDGCFIADDNVILDHASDGFSYEDDGIHSRNVDSVLLRNHRKSRNITKIFDCGNLCGVPFHLYYMSCNIDHVFHGERNMVSSNKIGASKRLSKRMRMNPNEYRNLLNSSEIKLGTDYISSWKELMEGNESLNRHTNISYFFEDLS